MAPMMSFRWCPISCLVMQRRSFGPIWELETVVHGIVGRDLQYLLAVVECQGHGPGDQFSYHSCLVYGKVTLPGKQKHSGHSWRNPAALMNQGYSNARRPELAGSETPCKDPSLSQYTRVTYHDRL